MGKYLNILNLVTDKSESNITLYKKQLRQIYNKLQGQININLLFPDKLVSDYQKYEIVINESNFQIYREDFCMFNYTIVTTQSRLLLIALILISALPKTQKYIQICGNQQLFMIISQQLTNESTLDLAVQLAFFMRNRTFLVCKKQNKLFTPGVEQLKFDIFNTKTISLTKIQQFLHVTTTKQQIISPSKISKNISLNFKINNLSDENLQQIKSFIQHLPVSLRIE